MKPKYEQLADKLREMILAGDYLENELIPSENTLQETYQLSRHTVRQAIGILVNEGYLRKERGSGTYVSRPDNQPPKKSKTIGVIMTYLSNYIFPSIIRGMEQEFSSQGYSLLLGITNNDHAQERECLKRMMEQGVDGLIIEPTKSNQYNPNLSYYVALREREIPFLMINAYYEELDVQAICVNDTRSGYLATSHLIQQGHKHILLLTKIDDLQGKYRMKGFIKAIQEANLTLQEQDILTYTTETKSQVLESLVVRLTKHSGKATGIVAYNDEIAYELIDQLAQVGLAVPQNISIVGNDDSELAIGGRVPLTTLTHPKEEMGSLAAQYIIEAINGGDTPSYYFQPSLIVRDSVLDVTQK
ncbi:GntR family transcriptional regulator [Enterococcus asini]|uniref:GntR family transcriptional regulator n=1 Tax=Enterococcus asini TaxID=57732 RepID=A0AAW8TXZ5_9ENTE|nr:GntR family transcriptional regulator [Enterococcus asini]MCD5028666.1 GntR family transcriptional regulator [Enterococcus asini]MDT2783072.1 GntR family transcriptional regulator [Enterococcus asini]MDT2810898.1 GntR family transcriptional regulator [Enterococcus asini]